MKHFNLIKMLILICPLRHRLLEHQTGGITQNNDIRIANNPLPLISVISRQQ